VPIIILYSPDFILLIILFFLLSFSVNLFNNTIFILNLLSLSEKVSKCCCDKIVVGHSIITWYPFNTALKAALMAISVFPNPTSPHINLSIGRPLFKSLKTSFIAFIWSFVSIYLKSSLSWFSNSISSSIGFIFDIALLAEISSNSPAYLKIFSFILCFLFIHIELSDNLCRVGFSLPIYLSILSIDSTGTNSLSPPS